jgi:hypothetical protein
MGCIPISQPARNPMLHRVFRTLAAALLVLTLAACGGSDGGGLGTSPAPSSPTASSEETAPEVTPGE